MNNSTTPPKQGHATASLLLGVFSFWGFFFVPFLPPISAVFSIILGVRSIGIYAKEKRPWSLLVAFIGATLGCMGLILAIYTYIEVYTY